MEPQELKNYIESKLENGKFEIRIDQLKEDLRTDEDIIRVLKPVQDLFIIKKTDYNRRIKIIKINNDLNIYKEDLNKIMVELRRLYSNHIGDQNGIEDDIICNRLRRTEINPQIPHLNSIQLDDLVKIIHIINSSRIKMLTNEDREYLKRLDGIKDQLKIDQFP